MSKNLSHCCIALGVYVSGHVSGGQFLIQQICEWNVLENVHLAYIIYTGIRHQAVKLKIKVVLHINSCSIYIDSRLSEATLHNVLTRMDNCLTGYLSQNMFRCHSEVWNLYHNSSTFTGVLYGLFAVALYIYPVYYNKTCFALFGIILYFQLFVM